jgi:Zn-dependent protease
MAGVAVAYAFGSACLLAGDVGCFLAVSLASFLAVIPHEVAHRSTARRMGCASRFLISPIGLLVTLLTSLPFIPVKFIMPGFTVISPFTYDREELRRIEGLTSLAGPLYNIGVAVSSIILLKLPSLNAFNLALLTLFYTATINAWVALFNLLPIPPLDGLKVLRWKPLVYVVVFALSILLYYYTTLL